MDMHNWYNPMLDFAYSRGPPSGRTVSGQVDESCTLYVNEQTHLDVPCKEHHYTCQGSKLCPLADQSTLCKPYTRATPHNEIVQLSASEQFAVDFVKAHNDRICRGYKSSAQYCEGRIIMAELQDETPILTCEQYCPKTNHDHFWMVINDSYDMEYLKAVLEEDDEEITCIETEAESAGFGPLATCSTVTNFSSKRVPLIIGTRMVDCTSLKWFTFLVGLLGIVYLKAQQDKHLPVEERYIRRIIELDSSTGEEYTDNKDHEQELLKIEFELAGWESQSHQSITFCRAFVTSETAEAHLRLYKEIDNVLKEDCGERLKFYHLHASSVNDFLGMILLWTGDHHPRQAKDWAKNKLDNVFVLPGICWERSAVHQDIWMVGPRHTNNVEITHFDVNEEGRWCMLVRGLEKSRCYNHMKLLALQAHDAHGICPSYCAGHPTENTIEVLHRKFVNRHKQFEAEDTKIVAHNDRCQVLWDKYTDTCRKRDEMRQICQEKTHLKTYQQKWSMVNKAVQHTYDVMVKELALGEALDLEVAIWSDTNKIQQSIDL
ncbi:hypothetical protein CPB85DRAFT_1256610 [Mucidula mucida]|nr:hypothetical protein CPB85DRAFT_1260611 [Mucidula mucida]KAF8900627.1 hypothetical protein CPB85DRAFT_1256610 [Mucidula mucida]